MNDKTSSKGDKPTPVETTDRVTESVNNRAEQSNPTDTEEETDRKQDESIASLAEQTEWIARQTKWIKYQVLAASFLGAVTLGVLIYHGWIMRRQSQAMSDQTAIMKGQLESMNSSSGQTQQMIAAMQKQADASTSQAGTSQALAEQNKELVAGSLAQAEAANKSAEIAQQSFYIGDRPYLVAGFASIDKFEPGETPMISFAVKNAGKTPALNVRVGVVVSVENVASPNIERIRRMSMAEVQSMDAQTLPYPSMPEGSSMFLPANEGIGMEARGPVLNPMLIEDIRNMKRFLFFWGFASYKDGLQRLHTLKFCLFYDSRNDSFIACPTSNSAN